VVEGKKEKNEEQSAAMSGRARCGRLRMCEFARFGAHNDLKKWGQRTHNSKRGKTGYYERNSTEREWGKREGQTQLTPSLGKSYHRREQEG